MNITSEGRPHLRAPLGTETYVAQSIQKKVAKWCLQLKTLCSIAITQPHAIFAAFTHSVVHQWTYLARTVPNIGRFFTPIEDIKRSNLIPSLTGRAPPGDLERLLLSLPPRLGGLGFTIPTNLSAIEFDASMTVTKPLYDLILQKKTHYPLSVIEAQIQAKKQLHQSKQQQTQDTAANLLPQLSESSQRSMVLIQEKGASSWLTTLPISEHGFALHKGAFRDALALRYGWDPPNTPSHCI